jgi:hypothetical protein
LKFVSHQKKDPAVATRNHRQKAFEFMERKRRSIKLASKKLVMNTGFRNTTSVLHITYPRGIVGFVTIRLFFDVCELYVSVL